MDDQDRIKELELRLQEAEETLDAIRTGKVDALLVAGPEGQKVYTLQGADYPYRMIVEQMAEGAVSVIEDGTIIYSNERLAEMVGLPPGSLAGKRFPSFVAREDVDWLERLIRDPKRPPSELKLVKTDGARVPVYVSARTLELEGQQVTCIIVTDLTLQKRLEDQLRHAQKMEAIGTLAGGIAHDFNNILAAVLGFAELLRDRLPSGSNEKRFAQRVFEAAIRGREVVRQLLAFARQMKREKKQVSPAELIKETSRFIRASIPSTIALEFEIEDNAASVTGDPAQLQQVLLNLCTNAADAMRERGGTLTIGFADVVIPDGAPGSRVKPGKYVKLWVRDTGVGMREDEKKRVFDPFFTTKPPGQGTGLGLSTVLGIVRAHDGTITVDSSPGRGATFTVYLPVGRAEDLKEAAPEQEAPRGKGHILFVDDEESLVEMGREILEDLGYRVTATNSSTRALAVFISEPGSFDAVVTDQTMPNVTGMELARRLIEARRDIPVVLVTGFSHLVDEERARAAGVRAFLMKPLTKAEMARALAKVLNRAP